MNSGETPRHPALDKALSEIRDEHLSSEVVDAAAARVWARLSGVAAAPEHIRTCSDFQALFTDFRTGQLAPERALLVQDHLHECVACRRIYEGRPAPTPIPLRTATRRSPRTAYWAIAATVVAAGGLVIWFQVMQGNAPGHALVQSVDGTLYEVTPTGLRVMKVGEMLPDNIELRTASGTAATVFLADGSAVEMRERSDFATSRSGSDATIHLDRGSIIVQAAKRRAGHLYVATADCRVAVTGTVFGVSTGVLGSRVSVMQGEVHLTHDNRETVLHPGDQAETTDNLEPVPVLQDFSWTRNSSLQRQLASLGEKLSHLPLSQQRYSSRLLGLLPAATAFYASIPNLAQYLAQAQQLFKKQAAENPELQAWLSGPGAAIGPVLEKSRAVNEYLGEEIVVFGTPGSGAPVVLAEAKRPGLEEFLRKQNLPLAFAVRGNLVLFSPRREALDIPLDSGFQKTPFYSRIVGAYREGAGILVCADLAQLSRRGGPPGVRYLIAEEKEIGHQVQTRAALGFDGQPTGIASWLGAPSPMGALDYISSDATFVAAFAVNHPAEILKEESSMLPQGDQLKLLQETAATLGGEFAIAMDGPPFPVPSWKLVAEVYEPERFRQALDKFVAQFDQEAPANGRKPLRRSQETVNGRIYYTLAGGDPNPLTEAHYTFASGYLIAAPTRALLTTALSTKESGVSITRSQVFSSLLPRGPHTNFSAVVFQNLANTLAPLAGFLGPKASAGMTNIKPSLITADAEKDRIAVASTGDMLGMQFDRFLSGGLFGLAGGLVPSPFSQMQGTTARK